MKSTDAIGLGMFYEICNVIYKFYTQVEIQNK